MLKKSESRQIYADFWPYLSFKMGELAQKRCWLFVTEIQIASKFWEDSYSHRWTIVSQLSKTKYGLL